MIDEIPKWVGDQPGQMEQTCTITCKNCQHKQTFYSHEGVLEFDIAYLWAVTDGWRLSTRGWFYCVTCLNEVRLRTAAPHPER
jgi:hypothetical protein